MSKKWSYNLDGDKVHPDWEYTTDGDYQPKGTKYTEDGDKILPNISLDGLTSNEAIKILKKIL